MAVSDGVANGLPVDGRGSASLQCGCPEDAVVAWSSVLAVSIAYVCCVLCVFRHVLLRFFFASFLLFCIKNITLSCSSSSCVALDQMMVFVLS